MARLGLHRTGNTAYSRGYLRSREWFARRRRWFEEVRAAGMEPACVVCSMTEPEGRRSGVSLDLHHVSYAGVEQTEQGRWIAAEAHEDLMPLCRHDHQRLHQMMDGRREFYGWDRERATLWVVTHLIRAADAGTRTRKTRKDG